MKQIILYIQRRLSLRLGLLIVLVITLSFSVLFDYLFSRGKRYLQKVAIERAEQLLDNTAVQINGIMDETELITNYLATIMPSHLCPDSLLAFSRRTVIENDILTGVAISMEPYFFPEMGRYYSAYSLRQDDTITTVREGPFEYFEKVWYKTPRTLGAPCWVDCYDDYNEGTLSSRDILTSYCCPMRDAEGKYVGSITTSLTLKWLSQSVSSIKPYPNSSAIMIGRTGTYLVHPDTAKLYKETIFSDAAPESQREINILGKAMLAGRSGMTRTIVDGNDAFIFYRPVERTGWSIAIVCPASDVFKRYNQLLITVWVIIGIGLLLLLLFCYQTVRRAVIPLRQLSDHAQLIADGNFDDVLPISTRHDSIGRLTNSFISMQHSLAESVSNIKQVNAELERQNKELARAYELQVKADEEKTAFIQNISHQIRTPLNIISGFTQVLTTSRDDLPQEEVDDITFRIMSSAKAISHVAKLFSASSVGNSQLTHTTFSCNELCREALAAATPNKPDTVNMVFETTLPDDFSINTDRQTVRSILDELLDNSCKFTAEGSITVGCSQSDDNKIIFSVSNTGAVIHQEARDRIFVLFTKLDAFTEGIGLGLSISRHKARQLGGELIYDETYLSGTRFVFTL